MPFDLELTDDQQQLREKCHTFSREVIRPVAAEYDREQELPWPVLEEAAQQGLYDWQLYAEASTDPTGLSLAIVMEELFWGCAGIGLTIVLPALALAAIRQAATDVQLAEWAPQCFGTPGDIKLGARRDRAQRRQRRPLDPDARAQGRRRLGHRWSEGLHRQRRDRRRARGR